MNQVSGGEGMRERTRRSRRLLPLSLSSSPRARCTHVRLFISLSREEEVVGGGGWSTPTFCANLVFFFFFAIGLFFFFPPHSHEKISNESTRDHVAIVAWSFVHPSSAHSPIVPRDACSCNGDLLSSSGDGGDRERGGLFSVSRLLSLS